MPGLRRALLLSVLLLLGLGAAPAAAQETKDNSGKDFWLAFNANDCCGNAEQTLFLTGEVATTGTVTVPGAGFSEPFTVTPGTVTTVVLPDPVEIHADDTIETRGVHVVSDQEVVVYGLNRVQFTTDAFLGLPTDVVGTEYTALAWGPGAASSQLGLVATQDDTSVTITPSVASGSGRAAGVAYSIDLDQGQTYQLKADDNEADLTGTRIVASKPVSAFGGNGCARIPTNGFFACDHVVEQLQPDEALGTSFLTVPLATRQKGDTFKFLAVRDATEVKVNGTTVATLNAGQVHQQIVEGNATVTANNPINVAQHSNGTSYDGVTSDPFMMLVPPFEQFETGYTVTTPATGFRANYVNLVVPDAAVGTVKLDGTPVPASEFTAIGTSGFSGAQVKVELGSHTLTGDGRPFGAFVYGFDDADSYGYPAGLSLAPIARVEALALTPATATVLAGQEHCVTAKVTDQAGLGVGDVRVDFEVSGANPGSASVNASAAGEARHCYVGKLGDDRIRATVGSLSAEATARFVASLPAAPVAPAAGGGVAGKQLASCAGLRRFNIRIRYPSRKLRSLEVTIGGRKQRIVKRRPRYVVAIDLRGRPLERTEVKIRLRTKAGKLLKGSRFYRPCTTKKPGPGFKY